MATLNVRTQQIALLRQMLNFNRPLSGSVVYEPYWKVLVYDKSAMDILSPLFTVKELRDCGVTLHLNLDGRREPLPDVPCIYFVVPTKETIASICQDLANGMYESYFLNFVKPLSRTCLEDLATSAVQADCLSQVQKVFDQYLSFISLEDDLFTLERHSRDSLLSFYSINQPHMSDSQMDEIVSCMADGLFSVCVTLGMVPIIRCPRGNAAELVAQKLNGKIRDNLRDARNSLFTGNGTRQSPFTFQRPVLIICDRSIDLATPLHHMWTYQALVHDVLAFDLNRVVIADAQEKAQEYDIAVNDKFWTVHKTSPFPKVAEAIQEELESYRSREEEIRKLKSVMGFEDQSDETVSMLAENTADLTSAMKSLPELLERKRLIDLHTNIATATLEQIKVRKLDSFFEAEEKVMNHQNTDLPVLEMVRDTGFGQPQDKLRLALIKYLCSDMTDGELSGLISALESQDCDTSAFKYLRRIKQFSGTNDAYDTNAGGVGGTMSVSMFSKLLSQSSQFIMEGVKNLVIQKRNLHLTRIVDCIMEAKGGADVDDYLCFDPKMMKEPGTTGQKNALRTPFNEAIVFMVGGGTYAEYHNLLEYRKNKRVIFGCTELVNGRQFLEQLTRLGSEM